MKSFSLLTLGLSLTLHVLANDSTLYLHPISHEAVFEKAQADQKPVLLYFHFDGCGACYTMEETAFVDPAVAHYVNSTFIAAEVNTLKGEGIETNKIYGVQMHPTFMFLDANGNILHKIVGVFEPAEFLKQAKIALEPSQRLAHLTERYKAGERTAAFLLDYCYALRDADELPEEVVTAYMNTQSEAALKEPHNLRFIYEFALHQFDDYMPYGTPGFNLLSQNPSLFEPYFPAKQVTVRILLISLNNISKATKAQDEERFDALLTLLKNYEDTGHYFFQEMDGRNTAYVTTQYLTYPLQLSFYKGAGDEERYNAAWEAYVAAMWDDGNELTDVARKLIIKNPTSARLAQAKPLVMRSLELDSNYQNRFLYATLLYEGAELASAHEQATIASELARAVEDQDTTDIETLLGQIKAAMNPTMPPENGE